MDFNARIGLSHIILLSSWKVSPLNLGLDCPHPFLLEILRGIGVIGDCKGFVEEGNERPTYEKRLFALCKFA